MKEIVEMLREHGIKETPNRILVLGALLDAHHPMTMMDIAGVLETVDKSNVFRTLATFREHHLVHAFEAGDEGTQYEVCRADVQDPFDDDTHVHFHCNKCHCVYCLEDVPVPEVRCPEGFDIHGVSYVLNGICPKCGHK